METDKQVGLELSNKTADLTEYLNLFRRRKWWVIAPFAPTVLIFFIASFFLPKVYEASTIILVEEEGLVNPLIQGLAVSTSVRDRLQVLREEILSWPRVTQLIEDLNLDEGIRTPRAFEKLVYKMQRDIKVEMKDKNIVKISYRGRDPKSSQKVVQTISEIFIQRNLRSQNEEADSAVEFIQSQLNTYRKKLEESEEALRNFKETYAYELPIASRLTQALIEMEIELHALLIENTEEHPAVVALRKKIERFKEERAREIARVKAKGISIDKEEFDIISTSVPRQEQELARLTRDYQVNEAIYSNLLQRFESANISQSLEDSKKGRQFRILEPARLPLVPVKPRLHLVLLFGVLTGLTLGGGLAYLKELTDASLKTYAEANAFLSFPILGTISRIKIIEEDFSEREEPVRAEA